MILSKNRSAIFLTNDSRAVRYCRDSDIKVLDLRDILFLLFMQKALKRDEIIDLIRIIEDKDNIIIKNKSDLLYLMKLDHAGAVAGGTIPSRMSRFAAERSCTAIAMSICT